MKASELIKALSGMVADYGDYEVGVYGEGGRPGPLTDASLCFPSKSEREDGAAPYYLISGGLPQAIPKLTLFCGDEEGWPV